MKYLIKWIFLVNFESLDSLMALHVQYNKLICTQAVFRWPLLKLNARTEINAKGK